MSDSIDTSAHPLRAASEAFALGDFAGAESASNRALRLHSNNPQALRMSARCRAERGHPEEALTLSLQAIRAMRSTAAAAEDQSAAWSELQFYFVQSLSGLDSRHAAQLRSDYAIWR